MSNDTIAQEWPPVRGDYTIVNPESRISVVTLASDMDPLPDACIMGSCKTENLGIEKIIANTISNSNIRYILVCGQESKGHLSGNTLLAIHNNGIDEKGRIVGSNGAIPFIENIPLDAIEHFRAQVEFIDRRGLVETGEIQAIIEEYKSKGEPFPHPPMVVQSAKKKKRVEREIKGADVMINNDILMDTTSGVVFVQT
ncbi:MAG: tetrahydromethanopterin S-methyltransferase subunit A [ANME-2 cluster archaeon]|jgi:tetrahydromethanopterin S-methyltransferase subunit A|nr:tetrahydromethanopterin S-methyltransferase subunit A [ANME-2 cluster archaeon]